MKHLRSKKPKEFEEKVIRISRVSQKTKGGDQMSFTALMVVGDKKGKVGLGLGKAKDVVSAIRKGVRLAKRKMIQVPIENTTIPFPIQVKRGAGKVLLKPAPKGSGVIAGGPVRAVVEAAGIKDISAKILGSDNQASSVYATFAALKKIIRIVKVRGIEVKREKEKSVKKAKSNRGAKRTKTKKKVVKKKKNKPTSSKKTSKSKKDTVKQLSKERTKNTTKKTTKKKKSATKKSNKAKDK